MQPHFGKRHPKLPFLFPDQVASASAEFAVTSDREATIDLQRLMIRAEFIRPLSGMQIVFSGRLRTLSRPEAEALAIRLGGKCQDVVDVSTDLLVVGNEDAPARPARRGNSIQEETARELNAEGRAIQIVDEDEFLGLVISPADPAKS